MIDDTYEVGLDDELAEAFDEDVRDEVEESEPEIERAPEVEPLMAHDATLYRIHSRLHLSCGKEYEKGVMSTLSDVSTNSLQALLERGWVTEARLPPLGALPGWYKRAEMLSQIGIKTVGQLVSADIVELAKRLYIEVEEVETLVNEVKTFLKIT